MFFALGYFVVGLVLGVRCVSTGRYGTIGPIGTVAAYCLLWPVIVLSEKR